MSQKTKTTTFSKGNQPRWTQMAPATFQVEQGEDKDGPYAMVEGQAAVYGNWFQVYDSGTFQVQRMNRPGMFQRSLAQNPDIAFRINHQDALARTGAGTLQVWETDQALMFKGRLNLQMTTASDVYQAMKDGLIEQGSVQYWPTKVEEWSEQNEDRVIQYEDVKEGKIDHGDVSVVLWGANPQCSTSLAQMALMARTLQPVSSVAVDAVAEPEVKQEQAKEVIIVEPGKVIEWNGQAWTAEPVPAEEQAPEPEPANDLLSQKEQITLLWNKGLLADQVKHPVDV